MVTQKIKKFLPISQSPSVGPMVAGLSMLVMEIVALKWAVPRVFGAAIVNA